MSFSHLLPDHRAELPTPGAGGFHVYVPTRCLDTRAEAAGLAFTAGTASHTPLHPCFLAT